MNIFRDLSLIITSKFAISKKNVSHLQDKISAILLINNILHLENAKTY